MTSDHHTHAAGLSRSPGLVLVALLANTVLAGGQVVFGLLLGSIALLADSVHQLSDVVALLVAYVALRLAVVGVTRRNTWGWGRTDVLGAFLSALLLLGSSVWIAVESIERIADPGEIQGWGVLAVAVVGLVVNTVSALLLNRVTGSMAAKVAVVHLIGDAAGSAGVVVAAVAVLVADATWVDPAVAILIALWLAWSGIGLLRSSGRTLLNLVPIELDASEVVDTIAAVGGVSSTHHLHLWEAVPGEPLVSAHLVVEGEMAVHESQVLLERVRRALHDRHGIDHTTFEVECHPCEDPSHGCA